MAYLVTSISGTRLSTCRRPHPLPAARSRALTASSWRGLTRSMRTAAPDLVSTRILKDVRYSVRTRISRLPWYLELARRGRHRDEAVDEETVVVIDGFPRSANTFASIAFQVAQERPVKIAHHLHSVANIVAGIEGDIPVLALIRHPCDTVVSEVLREEPVSIRTVLAAYCRFYEALAPYVERLVVGRFEQATTEFGSLIHRINDRFGTSFGLFDHTKENVALVFRLIDHRETDQAKMVDQYLSGRVTLDIVMAGLAPEGVESVSTGIRENAVPRPAAGRAGTKALLESQLMDERFAALRERADQAYRRVAESAG
jgi:hypothetical protein